ncbi:StAR-related lipid transfer protein 7, mitochondrial, partial [Linum perenne]
PYLQTAPSLNPHPYPPLPPPPFLFLLHLFSLLPFSGNPRLLSISVSCSDSIEGFQLPSIPRLPPMALWSLLLDILQRPKLLDVLAELTMLAAPLWIAVIIGVLVGWSWKPKWAVLSAQSSVLQSPASSSFKLLQFPSSFIPWVSGDDVNRPNSSFADSPPTVSSDSSGVSFSSGKGKTSIVSTDDLEYLSKLVEVKDGGPSWIQMMDRSTPTMSYQAWRRDLESGPPQYRSSTVYEDATPEMVRDFFWDDEFRAKWDDMLLHSETLEKCPTTGTMMVQWVRKFPFFCSDREYIIGRRIWESDRTYYCVTKGVPCTSVPRRNKPRRVDLYYSSWCIRAVESKRGNGQMTACEVLLFHYEDMGIPWEIAKLGVRQGMWGAVKKIEPGLRKYQKEREAGAPLSPCATMAQIITKVSPDYLESLDSSSGRDTSDSTEVETSDSSEKAQRTCIPRILVVGGAIALACTLDKGLLTKAVIFGVGRRFAKIGKRF